MLGSEEDGPPLDDEQFVCLEATLGTEALARLFSEDGDPPFEAVAAMLRCGMEKLGPE